MGSRQGSFGMSGVGSSSVGEYRKVTLSGLILIKALGVADNYGCAATRRETSQAIDSVSRFLFLSFAALPRAQASPCDQLRASLWNLLLWVPIHYGIADRQIFL
jgi:hypothetical protein